MPNVIQIKRTTTSNIPTSNSGGDITAGELAYSYSAADGSGNESGVGKLFIGCLLYTSPSPRDQRGSRMTSSA